MPSPFASPGAPAVSFPGLPLSPQLDALAGDFRHSTQQARGLLLYSNEAALHRRPSPASWSAVECVVHLNLANAAMLPGIRQAVAAAPQLQGEEYAYRMDFAGRFLAWSLEPPAFIKLKASKLADPLEIPELQAVVDEFVRLHDELLELLQASTGKEIDRQKMKSPFANVNYNAYSAFRIIAAHDRRHLWQARKALTQ